ALFVDSSRDACRTIGANLEKLGLKATVLCTDAERALAGERGPYDLILADPPHGFDRYDRLAPHVARLLAADGLFVLQTPAAAEPTLEGLTVRTSRRYGAASATPSHVW